MASGNLASCEFRVGDWLVQPSLTRIRRGSETVRVTPRAMQVLVQLAEAEGAVVSRNALLDTVWPRMAVTQDALSQCIVELRKAFGDDSRNPKVIETIPKVGVRLLSPVSRSETSPVVESGDAATERPEREPTIAAEVVPTRHPMAQKAARHRWIWAGTVTAVVIGIALGALGFLDTPGRPRSIAVLPFEYDHAAEQSVRVFAEALHDELLYRLGQIRAFEKVVPHRVVMGYRDTAKTVREIGEELGVATILEGRVHSAGDAVRLNVELIDTRTSELLWRESYTMLTAGAFFAIQSDITVRIAEGLDAALSPAVLARVRDVPPTNAAGLGAVSTKSTTAYRYYEDGNELWDRSLQRQRILPLVTLSYELATQADPEFAEAWAWLGIAHTGMYFMSVDRTPERLTRAEGAIARAFALDSDLPEAHFARANYLDRGMGDYDAAIAEYALAARLKPQQPDLYHLRAGAHRRNERLDASVADLDTALELDPMNVVYMRQQHINYLLRRDYERAEAFLDRIIGIAPDEGAAYVDKAALGLYRDGDTGLANQYEGAAPAADYANVPTATHTRWLAAVLDRNYPKALRILDSSSEDPVSELDFRSVPKSLLYARTYRLDDNDEEAVIRFKAAKYELERQLAAATSPRETAGIYVALAEVQAALGQADDAASSLTQAGKLTGQFWSQARLASILGVLLPLGETERALEELDDYLDNPGAWAIEGLVRDPRLDPIRDDPRFAALVEKHGRH